MTLQQVMNQLQEAGTEQSRKIYIRHGCDIDQYGVSMKELKRILKPIKKDTELGKQLFLSQNADAIYLSQWMVSIDTLSDTELEQQLLLSHYYMLIENAIPSIISNDLQRSYKLIHKWLYHTEPRFRQAANSLLGLLLGLYPDEDLEIDLIKTHLDHIKQTIHEEENRVKYAMNNVVIAVGTYLKEYTSVAKEVADDIGTVDVFMGETSCKVPHAYSYIEKVESMNRVGQKRKR